MTGVRTRRSDRFLAALAGRQPVLVTHDNPDPDAIASGWALLVLLRAMQGGPVRLLGRGAIVRGENRHLVRLLRPPLELVDELPNHDSAIVLVDCLPTRGNHLLDGRPIRPAAVIDHHEPEGDEIRADYRDVRPAAAATAIIAAGYLREQGIVPEADLATALLYAVYTEISGPAARLTRTDRSLVSWLSGLADHARLSEIAAAPLPRAYFADLLLALEQAYLYDDAAVCFLPQASGAEIVGEVADLLVRCEGVRKVLCAAALGHDLVVSARTTVEGGNVLPLLGATLNRFGSFGGHRHRAGGKVDGVNADGRAGEMLFTTIKECWLSACNVDRKRGSRLVPRQAILEGVER